MGKGSVKTGVKEIHHVEKPSTYVSKVVMIPTLTIHQGNVLEVARLKGVLICVFQKRLPDVTIPLTTINGTDH